MKLAMIGLGKMGANMVRKLREKDFKIIGFNKSPEKTKNLASETGMEPVFSLNELIERLDAPRIVWSMVPAGKITENIIDFLYKNLSQGDIVIDGGNSFYKDSINNAKKLYKKGIHLLDIGVSGGIWGLKEGYSMMIGGEKNVVNKLSPLFEALAPGKDKGWGYVGPSGAGHFTKMVHNGIEYGMMEAIAEGFEIMFAKKEFNLDLEEVARIWQHGSVVRSWLLDLSKEALAENKDLSNIEDWVFDSGEGRWTVLESIELGIPAPIIADSLYRRFDSRQDDSFALKLLSAMRNKFGGHSVKESK